LTIEALNDAGTLTATEAAERVGESPSNCSFHLRQITVASAAALLEIDSPRRSRSKARGRASVATAASSAS
jgi:hypothetical protein